MTLSSMTNRASYAGDGTTTSFPFSFKIWAASDVKVFLRDTATLADTMQTPMTQYTLSGSLPGTGAVNFVIAPTAAQRIVILRDAAATQELDLQTNGAFAADNVESALDKVVGLVQSGTTSYNTSNPDISLRSISSTTQSGFSDRQ